jgi:hypothetical protein
MKKYLIRVALCLMSTIMTANSEEIFFNLKDSFNARILADNADKKSGIGFGGDMNAKCLNPSVTSGGIMQAYNYVDFKIGDIKGNNAILIPLNNNCEVPLSGKAQLTSLAILYVAHRYDDSGSGAGKITLVYADGTTQEFPWPDPGKSGIRNTNFSQTAVSNGGFFEYYIARDDKNVSNPRFHSRVLSGLNPDKPISKVFFDTNGFIDPGNDAEWAIFAVTGNGKLTEKTSFAEVNSGIRPYELDWAKRNQDEYPPFVDFQDLSGWKASGPAKIYFNSTSEKPLFLPKSARIEMNTIDRGEILLSPPAPLALPKDFNAVSLWIYGDGFNVFVEYAPTNKLTVTALFRTSSGESLNIPFIYIRHGQWFQAHHQFTQAQMEKFKNGGQFLGFKITGFGPKENRVIYLSSFSIFNDKFKPLHSDPQPHRGIALLPGADPGINTGKGKLPFPTREETILPLNFSKNFKNTCSFDGKTATFNYAGDDCKISYKYKLESGGFDVIEASITYPDGTRSAFKPAIGGGVFFGDKVEAPTSAKLLNCKIDKNVLSAEWEMTVNDKPVKIIYRLRIWQKSLVLDVLSEGGAVSQVKYGGSAGMVKPRLISTPYYTYNIYSKDRPVVVAAGDEQHPLFFSENTDWYLSNGSEPYALNSVTKDTVTSNGGVTYRPKTDGKRQNCAERLFFTVSPVYDEVLPTIANPVSPYRHIGYGAMWRSFGSSQSRYHMGRYFYRYWRQGIKQQILTDHEGLFRDHEESFTFRTKTAPLKGGDEGAKWISEYLRNTLGYVYGPYSQYTDIGTVNEYYKIDNIIRTTDNQLQQGWFRMYAPKPAWAQEIAAKIAPELKRKFGYTDSYCDVHTAIAPWQLVDYDKRAPGAATFAQTFYSYGQLFLTQKAAWDGPCYSEGNYHSFYAGLTDGDYAQDKGYKLAFNPWLVNFDLRNMHNLNANYGMGDMYMFMWESGFDFKKDKTSASFAVDRIIAATLAYGHAAIMPQSAPLLLAAPRTHFMAVPITRLYGLSPVKSIQYADANGKCQDTTKAILNGTYANSQLLVRYENSTVIVANGSPTERQLQVNVDGHELDLPQNGYAAWSADGKTSVISTLDKYDNRYDYAVTPEHIYIDGRGNMVRQELAAANGPAVLRILGKSEFEYIPLNNEFENDYLRKGESVSAGFKLKIDSVTALNYEMKALPDKVQVLVSRGLSWIMPVKDAHSYLIKGDLAMPAAPLSSGAAVISPGETATISGPDGQNWQFTVPQFAETGKQIWRQFGGQWIDFDIVAPFKIKAAVNGKELAVTVKSFLPQQIQARVEADGQKQAVTLTPEKTALAKFALPEKVGEYKWIVDCSSGNLKSSAKFQIKAFEEPIRYAKLTDKGVGFGVGLRGGDQAKKSASGGDIAAQNALIVKETVDVGGSGAMMLPLVANCGGVAKPAIGLQTPYIGDTGYVYLTYENIEIPAGSDPVLQTSVGKRDGSNPGDGIRYIFTLIEQSGKENTLGDVWVKKHEWVDFSKNLKPWAGQKVTLKFVCDAGAEPEGDWGALAYPEIVDMKKTMQYEVK